MIVVENLNKRYPGSSSPAIREVCFEVRDSEILGLVGLNGAGKTTTIRVIVGVSLPTSGRVLVDGFEIVSEKAQASNSIGWVPEYLSCVPEARAGRLLEYYAGFHGLRGASARDQVKEVLSEVGLSEHEDALVRTFSQGMRRRLGLAAAMLSDPQNLLLDEVMNGLDPVGLAFVRQWILDLRDEGRCILLSSHLLSELQMVADRIAFIHRGRVIRVIRCEELAQAGEKALHLKISNFDDGAIRYLREVGSISTDRDHVIVSRPTAPSSDINAELVRRGYYVTEIWSEDLSLEAFFHEIIRQQPSDPEGAVP